MSEYRIEDLELTMKNRVGVFAIVAITAFMLSYASVRAGQETKTTWDGVYSKGQATKGEAIYNEKCQKCHGADASGADAPSLADSGFAGDWDGLTVQQLFERTRSSMPQDAPQSLGREETAALIAYLLSKNNFPAGSADLSERGEMLGIIKYVATKPQ
jgi:quinoprotein glucose dehydrogenase